MYRKLILAAMALASFAALMVGPASASATNTPTLTVPANTDAAIGTKILGTASDTALLNTDGSTSLTCTTGIMTGEVTKNSGGNVEGNITSARFFGDGPVNHNVEEECTGFVNANITATTPWCLRSTTTMKTDEFQVRGGKCSEAAKSIVFHMITTGFGTCTYERTAATGPVTGTFNTNANAVLTVNATSAGSGFNKTSGSIFCPSSGMLQMSFSLESHDGKASPAVIDS